MQAETLDQLLREGIAAAKAGDRERAQVLLRRAVQHDATAVTGWLWLSGVVDSPEEQEACLERVLSLDPQHAAAQRGLQAVRQRRVASWLRESAAAEDAGDRARARELLMQVVARDEENVAAWLRLCRLVASPEDREVCYENVLALDPGNAEARDGLAALREEGVALADQAAIPEPLETGMDEADDALVLVAAEFWVRYEDELYCPYCAAPATLKACRCPNCGKGLWVASRRREGRSGAFWTLFALEAASTVWSSVLVLGALFWVGERIDLVPFTRLLPFYLGIGEVSPAMAEAALAILPQWAFWVISIPFFFSLLLWIGASLRWPPVFYVLIGVQLLGMVFSVAGMLLLRTLPALVGGAFILLLSLGLLLFVLRLEDDFLKKKARILLRVDGDLKSGQDFFRRGEHYASQRMWALAAVHFRRAAGMLSPRPAGYLRLAEVGFHLEDLEMVAFAIDQVQRMAPATPQLVSLAERLDLARQG